MLTQEAMAKFRPRRRHRKSRNGCMECKRRRIKCDEMKPSCSRCILTMQPCIYASTSPTPGPSTEHHEHHPSTLPTPSPHASSPSPPAMDRLRLSPAPQSCQTSSEVDFSDTALYHHYLTHTSRTLTTNTIDHHALQICLPTLALKSKTVFHSLLALSAACIACDMIYPQNRAQHNQHHSQIQQQPDVAVISSILMTGYHHCNLASERLREFVSRPNMCNAEPLLASPPLLVPFVTSAQQINHWISAHGGQVQTGSICVQGKLLTSTPRDVIFISRGISATIRALEGECHSPTTSSHAFGERRCEEMDSMDAYNTPSPTLIPQKPPSHNHPMYHIIASTSATAFSKLQDRLDSALFFSPSEEVSACAEAFKVLSTLRSAVFPPSSSSGDGGVSLLKGMTYTPTLPHLPPWLVNFTARPSTPSPTGHMTRPFLSFLVQVPQAYLDLILPLLDKRLEGPSSDQIDPFLEGSELTVEQALALDIYAHWSVLMILVGEESWWIGKLPDITLGGMVNRFGDGFVRRLWPDTNIKSGSGNDGGEWWPSSMLRVEREIGRYRT